MNTDILVKLEPILKSFNSKQKKIAMDMLLINEYSFLEYNGLICIKTKEGVYSFSDFVKSKCNCG